MPARLTVDGLPEWFTDYDLKELFAPYGHVLTARIIQAQYFPTYRFGFVEMVTIAEAELARLALNRTRIDDHLILVFIVSDEMGADGRRSFYLQSYEQIASHVHVMYEYFRLLTQSEVVLDCGLT